MSDARFNHIRIYGTGEPICNYYFKLDRIVINDFHEGLPSCPICHERLVGHNELEGIKERWQRQYAENPTMITVLPSEVERHTNKFAGLLCAFGFIAGMIVSFLAVFLTLGGA